MSKLNLTHFKFQHFKLVPAGTPESLNDCSFSIHRLDVVAKFENKYGELLPNVSPIMFFAATHMTKGEMVPAVVELARILYHYDTKSAINWPNTLSVVEFQLFKRQYKPEFIVATTEQIHEAIVQMVKGEYSLEVMMDNILPVGQSVSK